MEQSIQQKTTKGRGLVITGVVLGILEFIFAFGVFYINSVNIDIMSVKASHFIVWLIGSISVYPSLLLWIIGLIVGAVLLLRKRWVPGLLAILGALILLASLLSLFRYFSF